MSLAYVLVILLKFLIVSGNKWDCADYYWRDYHETIPDDAIPAGTDSHGKPLYIGLAYVRGYELLPATILPSEKLARTTAYAKVFNTRDNVKILCSPYPEAFEWISIESRDLHKYGKHNLIPGGSEVGENLYIGRVFRDNGVIVGKIFRHERQNRGIWFPLKNTHGNSLSYEILNYNCDSAIPKIDPRVNVE